MELSVLNIVGASHNMICGAGRTLNELATYQATDTKSVVLIVVVGRVQVRRVEVQVVRVVVAVRRPTPIVAVRATIVRRRTIEVAGVKENSHKLPNLLPSANELTYHS